MKITFRGVTTEFVSQDKMTPGEIDAVERATGLTFGKIQRMGQTCVCDHPLDAHRHKDDVTGDVTDVTSCARCACEEFGPDVPSRVSTAFIWVSLRRADLTLKFADVSDAEGLTIVQDAVEADPTVAPVS